MEAEQKEIDKNKQRIYHILTALLAIGVVVFAIFMPPTTGVFILVAVLAMAALLHMKKSKKESR